MMRKITFFILLCAVAACEGYQEPQANCFGFVSRGPTPVDCSFEALEGPHLEGVANE